MFAQHTHTHRCTFIHTSVFSRSPSCVFHSKKVQMIKWREKEKVPKCSSGNFSLSRLPSPESCCHTSQMWLQINIASPVLSAFRPWTRSHGRSAPFNVCLFPAGTLATRRPRPPTLSPEVSLSPTVSAASRPAFAHNSSWWKAVAMGGISGACWESSGRLVRFNAVI